MKPIKRAFSGAAVDFLIAARTILNSAYSHQVDLFLKSTLMTILYFDDIKVKIANAFNIIGSDKEAPKREATDIVLEIAENANVILGDMKILILAYFKKIKARPDEVLLTLGFTEYLEKAKKGDQEALISLLAAFRANLSPTIEAQLLAAGVPPAAILSLKNYADTLREADVEQESLKGTGPELTQADIITLNEVYDEIITIAKIGQRAFKDNPAVKDQFVYSKVLKRINSHHSSNDGPPSGPSPATE